MTDPVKIGLLGRGTVGAAFEALVAERSSAIEAATGRTPEISGVLTTSDGSFEEILASSDVIVELIGGTEPAREYVLAALGQGKPVITANKQLIAQHGEEIFDAARASDTQIRFEAAVAGAIPIIRVISESVGEIEIDRVNGIVNGTTNFILTEMARTGASYEDALADAQRLGYAEADPTDDVTGADAAAKMAILARLAFGEAVSLDDVSYEGIEAIRPDDLSYAKELGLSLKLLGVAERSEAGIAVSVYPCFLYPGHPLAPVEGAFNAVTVFAPQINEITLSGPGAGGPETASAVLGDLISVLAGGTPPPPEVPAASMTEDRNSAFYLHLEVADEPGVLASVAEILGRHGVSVRSVVQRGMGEDARLVMVMHEAPERAFSAAVDELSGLDFMRSAPRSIRVIEEEVL